MVLRSRLIIIAALIPLGLWQMADDAVCTPLSLSDPETYGSQGAVDALLNGRTGNESEINNVIQSARENLAPPSSEVFFEALADQPAGRAPHRNNRRRLQRRIRLKALPDP